MSYTFLLERAVESSAECFSDILPFAPSSWRNTLGKCCSSVSETESSLGSPSGMMSAPLMESHGGDGLTSCAADSRARTSVAPGKEPGSTDLGLAYGLNLQGSFVRFDQNTSLWRTHQCSFLGDSDEFSGTWPKWVSMRNAACWERTMPVLGTRGNECGSWPTPTASMAKGTNVACLTRKDGRSRVNDRLDHAVLARTMFPTPVKSDAVRSSLVYGGGNKTLLGACVDESALVGGKLNPPWVEWLMGWPIGWTDLKPLGMDRFQKWPLSPL